jgi:hypothetical protein
MHLIQANVRDILPIDNEQFVRLCQKKHEFVSTSALSAFLDITGRIDNETRERVREKESE